MFTGETIERFINHFKNIVSTVSANPRQKISQIEFIGEEEKRRLLYDFNERETDYPTGKTIHESFAEQAGRTPDGVAVVGSRQYAVGSKKKNGQTAITYRELNNKSDQLADMLKTKGIKPGAIAGIMMERSLEMIVGILAILKAGAAYLPINPKNPRLRTKYMLEDSGVEILITTEGVQDTQISPVPPVAKKQPAANLAYIIYTSGSTGNPKGVAVTHGNFCPLLHWGKAQLGFGPDDRVVQNLSYFFDWSVWEIFLALSSGTQLYMVEEELILNPTEYLEFIDKNRITVLHITPSHFQSLIAPGQKFETLKFLCIGAEKLTVDMVEQGFALISKDCRVFNMYGPTEATIIAAVLEIDPRMKENYRRLSSVPIGKPVGNTVLLVLDRNLELCPVNVQGELYIGGDGLARGYLNNPEITAEKFLAAKGALRINMSYLSYMSYIYKTGDLARWLPDGDMEFLGRIDHQVKIRGFRVELGEIENRLLEHDHIKAATVLTGKNEICAYIVSREKLSAPGLREYLARDLPAYMIPAYFLRIDNIPLTPNGKIDRKALPEPEFDSGSRYTAPANQVEETLAAIWSDVLSLDKNTIGRDANFFQLGGHSLNATILTAKIHREMDVKIQPVEIFKTPTIRGLAKYIRGALKETYPSMEPAEKKEYYPLSPPQKRFYILRHLDPDNTIYNMANIFILEGEVDREKLQKTFRQLIHRHETLRTSFITAAGEPVQQIHAGTGIDFEIEYYEEEESKNNIEEIVNGFIRPFDLSRSPLLRIELIKLAGGKYLFLLDMHHIISDAVSFELSIEEFRKLYAGEPLPGLRLQYKDYSEWRKGLEQSGEIERQEAYWMGEFSREIPVLDIPLDYERPVAQSLEGNYIDFEISPGEAVKLKEYAGQKNATMFMVLLALFYVFLSKLSGQEDIVIGTPAAGRGSSELYDIIGVFVNTMALRNYPQKDRTFDQFLEEIKQRTLEAFENQDYQFEELVNKVRADRDSRRNPIFDAMYNYSRETGNTPSDTFLNLKRYRHRYRRVMFDLILTVIEVNAAGRGGQLVFNFAYCTRLFKRETVEKFIRHFKEIVSLVVENRHIRLEDIDVSLALEAAEAEIPAITFGF